MQCTAVAHRRRRGSAAQHCTRAVSLARDQWERRREGRDTNCTEKQWRHARCQRSALILHLRSARPAPPHPRLRIPSLPAPSLCSFVAAPPQSPCARRAGVQMSSDASSSSGSASASPLSARAAFQTRRRLKLESELRVMQEQLTAAEATLASEPESVRSPADQLQLRCLRATVEYLESRLRPEELRKIGRRVKVKFENTAITPVQLFRSASQTTAAQCSAEQRSGGRRAESRGHREAAAGCRPRLALTLLLSGRLPLPPLPLPRSVRGVQLHSTAGHEPRTRHRQKSPPPLGRSVRRRPPAGRVLAAVALVDCTHAAAMRCDAMRRHTEHDAALRCTALHCASDAARRTRCKAMTSRTDACAAAAVSASRRMARSLLPSSAPASRCGRMTALAVRPARRDGLTPPLIPAVLWTHCLHPSDTGSLCRSNAPDLPQTAASHCVQTPPHALRSPTTPTRRQLHEHERRRSPGVVLFCRRRRRTSSSTRRS